MEPVWLRDDEEFLYSVDPYHAAIFSFATKSFNLLPDPGMEGRQILSDKAASRLTDKVALLLVDNRDGIAVALYDRGGSTLQRTFAIPAGIKVDFDAVTDELLVAYNRSPPLSTLAAFDPVSGNFRHLGRYRLGFDVIDQQRFGPAKIILVRRKVRDAWLYTGAGRQRLTDDGNAYSAAASSHGDLLISRLDDEGSLAIWKRDRGGGLRRLTRGPEDVLPSFAPDGRRWAYVDYTRKAIMLCDGDLPCVTLRREDLLPSWPRFSPDGTKLAYVTQAGAQRVLVLSLSNGALRDVGASFSQCPPVWSPESRLWIFERSTDRYAWVERDGSMGRTTGRRIPVPTANNNANEERVETKCWPSGPDAGLFYPRVEIETEETSSLLRLN